MRLKIITAIAVLLVAGACTTASELSSSDSSAGATKSSSATDKVSQQQASISKESATEIVPGTQADLVANVGDRVLFEYDSSDLTPEARRTLERQAAWLKRNIEVSVTIEGHCDERGTREYNLALGDRRATAVYNFLLASGVDGPRMQTLSFGKERPVALGSNETAWGQNRRGVTVVGIRD